MGDGAVDVWAVEGGYREGAADLLGILAYGALAAFERLAEDARRAPTLADKVHGAEMAAEQVAHFDRVRDRLAELDVDVMAAMQPFHAAFNAYHEHPSRRTGWRGWSGPMLATVSPPTSTGRSLHSSTRTPGHWCIRCWTTRARRRT